MSLSPAHESLGGWPCNFDKNRGYLLKNSCRGKADSDSDGGQWEGDYSDSEGVSWDDDEDDGDSDDYSD